MSDQHSTEGDAGPKWVGLFGAAPGINLTGEDDALREAAEWIAEAIGYPIQVTLNNRPMPQALWDALVNHVHVDDSGMWHGNTLDREEVEAWLADEAGRVIPSAEGHGGQA